MITSLYSNRTASLLFMFFCFSVLIPSSLEATEIDRRLPKELRESCSSVRSPKPASLDETTLELFVTALSDLHKTASNLSSRLEILNKRFKELKKKNKVLAEQNARLKKALSIQAAIPKKAWHAYPLDKEVKDANTMLDELISKLTGLSPREARSKAQREARNRAQREARNRAQRETRSRAQRETRSRVH